MTEFLTKDCNFIHVDMDYRLTDGNYNLGDATYVHMLADINSAINYLKNNSSVYHININSIALMGYSAGGHLALLYAYKAAAGHTINGTAMHDISLVISEAGPIHFGKETEDENGNITYDIYIDDNICAMVGITKRADNNYYPQELAILADASPYFIAQDFDEDTFIPYTILAYGNVVNENGEPTYSDGLVPIQPAIDLYNLLNNTEITLDDIEDTSGYLYSTANDNCILYYFGGVEHGQFGYGQDTKIYPNPQINNYNLKTAINTYYEEIKYFLT